MPVLKRQKADGSWEYVQTVGVDVVQLQAQVTELAHRVAFLEGRGTGTGPFPDLGGGPSSIFSANTPILKEEME